MEYIRYKQIGKSRTVEYRESDGGIWVRDSASYPCIWTPSVFNTLVYAVRNYGSIDWQVELRFRSTATAWTGKDEAFIISKLQLSSPNPTNAQPTLSIRQLPGLYDQLKEHEEYASQMKAPLNQLVCDCGGAKCNTTHSTWCALEQFRKA